MDAGGAGEIRAKTQPSTVAKAAIAWLYIKPYMSSCLHGWLPGNMRYLSIKALRRLYEPPLSLMAVPPST